jgi:hypothetical protein
MPGLNFNIHALPKNAPQLIQIYVIYYTDVTEVFVFQYLV